MNIDGTKLSEIFDTNNINQKNASVQTNSMEFVKGTEAFFDNENIIKKADNLNDAYDRIVTKVDTNKEGDLAITPETIKKVSDVVTPENYSKYQELGIEPDEDNPGSILTVSERIEIELAVNCEDYKTVGSISTADLEEMYGNRAVEVKDALEKVNELTPITKETSEFLLTNNMDLTINNVYMAEHSVSKSGSKKYQELSGEEWEELQPQIEKMLEKNGLFVSKENLENAKWLVEEKIPVMAENIYKLNKISEINSNMETGISSEDWLSNIASNMSYGISAGESSANYYSTIKSDSVEAVEIIRNGTEDQITTLVMDGKDVTLLNMKRAEENTTYKSNERRNEEATKEQKNQIVTERKNLEELRLKMTIEASATMIKNGINVDISSLSDLVNELKNMEESYANTIFETTKTTASPEKIDLFTQTNQYMKIFADTPSYILGDVAKGNTEFNVEDITVQGSVKEDILKSMQQAYDTLGTKPDKELGDSIKKAFSGIDEILENMNLENNTENQRAVRILAYNEMDITHNNIDQIKEMDTQVTRLIENLTPRTTTYLILNGINPLKTNIKDLNEELDKINQEIDSDDVEKYSEFLWKLEKNNDISKEDRDAYIGIYRLINMVEKDDRSSIGAVVKQGSELTMKNLLTSSRSMKKTGKETSIDDEFGTPDNIKIPENNIDNQLSQFESDTFLKRAKEIISPEKLKDIVDREGFIDLTLDEVINKIVEEDTDETIEENYYNELKASEVQQLNTISEEILQNIYQDGMDVNVNNLLATAYIIENKENTFSKIKNTCNDKKVNDDLKDLEDMEEDDVKETKDKIVSTALDIKEVLLSKSQINVGELRAINRVNKYIKNASSLNSFYIPSTIGDENATIKVTVETGTEDKGKVSVKIYCKDSEINAEFNVNHNEVKALVMTDQETIKNLQELEINLSKNLENINMSLKELDITSNSYIAEDKIQNKENDTISTATLFKIAKGYILGVKNCLK